MWIFDSPVRRASSLIATRNRRSFSIIKRTVFNRFPLRSQFPAALTFAALLAVVAVVPLLFGSLYPDDLQEGLELLHQARGSDEPQRKEKEAAAVRCVRGDGQMVWGSLKVQCGSRSGSGAGYLVLKAEDIDERKNAEMSMRSSTPREMEVLKLLCEGRSNPKIAERLAISAHRQVTRAKHHREARRRG